MVPCKKSWLRVEGSLSQKTRKTTHGVVGVWRPLQPGLPEKEQKEGLNKFFESKAGCFSSPKFSLCEMSLESWQVASPTPSLRVFKPYFAFPVPVMYKDNFIHWSFGASSLALFGARW